MLCFDCGPSVPLKTAWAPTPLAYRGPVSLLSETSENVTDDISEAETLGLRAPTPQMYVSAIVSKRPSALALERRLALRPQSRWGPCLMVRRSHGYPDFLPRLTHRRDLCVAWIRLPSVVAT